MTEEQIKAISDLDIAIQNYKAQALLPEELKTAVQTACKSFAIDNPEAVV